LKKVIGYERVQKLGRHGEPRVGWKPIFEVIPPIEPIGNEVKIPDIPPLEAKGRLWGRTHKERE